jgi:hypothetical protein
VTVSSIETNLRELFAAQARSLGVGEPPPRGELEFEIAPNRGREAARARPVLALAAAAAVLALGAGALWWALGVRDDSTPAGVPSAPLMPVDPPLLVLDAPGWEMQSFSQYHPAEFVRRTDPDQADDGRTTTFIHPALGVGGPRITVSVSNSGTTGLAVEEQSVAVGATTGVLYDDGDEKLVRWTEPTGNRLEAFGWSVSVDELVGTAGSLTVDDDGFPAAAAPLPLGLVAMTGRDAELMHSSVQYTWVDGSGRLLEVNLYPGGPTVLAQRADSCCDDGEQRREVVFQGADATVDQDEYLIRMDQLRGFWLWEIDGSASLPTEGATSFEGAASFEGVEDFLAVAEQIRVADSVVWRASLADDVVLGSEMSNVADELAVHPLPPGVAQEVIVDMRSTTTRTAIAQDIAAHTTCSWIAALESAVTEGDVESATTAIGVLRDVAGWDEIAAIPDRYPESDVATIVGRIRLAAEVLAPYQDIALDDPADDVDDVDELLVEIPLDEAIDAIGEIGCA